MEKIEFEHDWKIDALTLLRMVLKPGYVWMSKSAPGIIQIVDIVNKDHIECNSSAGTTVILTARELLRDYIPPGVELEYAGPIEYGAECEKCKRTFEYQRKRAGFKCWACTNRF